MANTNEKHASATATSPATEAVVFLQTKHLAAKFGMKAQQLRRILRSMPAYADGVHTKYRWAPTDTKAIAEIEKAIKAQAEKKAAAALAAKAALTAKETAKKEQEKLDKKAA